MTAPGDVHYLPHPPIVRDDKETTKIRIVFNASAKCSGPSLNECLYSGSNLLSHIFDILLRFRGKKIGILSDVRQAFLNVGIHDDHKNYLRFLWLDPDNCNETIIYRFLRVVFGVTSSPFLLQGTLRCHCDRVIEEGFVDPKYVEDFLNDLYVDDSIDGANSVTEGLEWYKTAKHLMTLGGFMLCKWCTNNVELQKLIDLKEDSNDGNTTQNHADESSFSSFQLGVKSGDSKVKSVLGINWDLTSDVFIFDFKDIIEMGQSIKMTKRNILRVSSSFYDPLGLISPISVQSKHILQLLYKEKLDWDSLISEVLVTIWNSFIKCLKLCPSIRVPRYLCMQRIFPCKFTDFVIVPVQLIVLQFIYGEKPILGYIQIY